MTMPLTLEGRVALLEDQFSRLSPPKTQEVEMSNHMRDFVRELKVLNRNMQDLTNEIRYVRGRM